MEYYLYYCSEEFAKNQDYEWATLIKIGGSFYYYHEKSGEWVTDTLYDDFCSSFTENWRNKSSKVVAISYDEAMDFIAKLKIKEDKEFVEEVQELNSNKEAFNKIRLLLSAMTYAYASYEYLFDEMEDEEGWVYGNIQAVLAKNSLFPQKINEVESEENCASILIKAEYEGEFANNCIKRIGGQEYRARLFNAKKKTVLKISRYEIAEDEYDGILRAYPVKDIGAWIVDFDLLLGVCPSSD